MHYEPDPDMQYDDSRGEFTVLAGGSLDSDRKRVELRAEIRRSTDEVPALGESEKHTVRSYIQPLAQVAN